jgi:hemolysin activation/secretion protein
MGIAAVSSLLAAPGAARGQEPIAGRIVPDTYRPKDAPSAPAIDLGRFAGQEPPAGADALAIQPGAVRFVGDPLPLPEAGERLVGDLLRGPQRPALTVAEVFEGAARLERELAGAGYVLTRVLTPPQKIEAGGELVFRVVNGRVDEVDVSALPPVIRSSVEKRLAHLVGRAPLNLAEIERALLIAGDLGGLSLRSTVATGNSPGGVRLVLDGGFNRVSGAAGIDRLASDRVGAWGINGSVAVNSLLGRGDQIYLAYQGDLKTFLREDARMRVAAAGAVFPLGDQGLTVGPEVVWARVRPLPLAGVPDSRNELLRMTLRATAPVVRTRNQNVKAMASLEAVAQTVNAVDFDTVLSADSYLAIRAGLDGQFYPSGSLQFLGSLNVSRGLGDIASPFSGVAGAPPTHRGATGEFTRASALAGMRIQGLTRHASVAVRGQSSFGEPLFNSEQLNLDGPDGMSSLCPGEFAVDQGFTVRAEFGNRLQTPASLPGIAEPYIFAALGGGEVFDPGGDRELRGAEVGFGFRMRFGRLGPRNTPVSLGFEYGRNWINSLENKRDDRANLLLGLSF